jgi:hypothetical protein
MTAVMARPTPSQLDELNTNVVSHELRVGDIFGLFANLAKSVPETQQVREFTHNAIHAIHSAGGGTLRIEAVVRHGVEKLAFVDTGVGMSGQQLRDLIGQLSSSARSIDGSRFGVGAKITGVTHNPLGLEYTTWNGVDAPVTATIGIVDGSIKWLGDEPFTTPSTLPALISAAGHGTQVVLLGATEDDPTFEHACGLPVKNKRFALHLNSRYYELPENVTLSLPAKRSKATAATENRSRDARGARAALLETAAHHGFVDVDGATVHWFHSDTESTARSAWRHSDNCRIRGFVAVAVGDAEVQGLSELYDLRVGQQGAAALASFGLGTISSNVALVIEPDHVEVNIGRTGVTLIGGGPLPWELWASQFKDGMPDELDALIVEAANDKKAGNDERLLSQLLKNPLLLNPSKFGAGEGAAASRGPGGNGSRNGGGRSSGGSGNGRRRNPSLGGGAGDGPGGTAADTGTGGGSGERNRLGVTLPQVIEIDGTRAESDGADGCIGYYDDANNLLFVNTDFGGIDQELAQHLHGRPKLSSTDRAVARRVVMGAMVDRVREAILRSKSFTTASPSWNQDVNRDFAYCPQALTMAALTAHTSAADTASEITRLVGGGRAARR